MSSPGVGPASQRLGRYHLAEPLGGGPTGEVFRAKVYGVAGFERQFAVKRFHPEFVHDPTIAETIASAARVYGSLEHPRIARLHEYGVTGGHTFTATELVQGIDLGRLLGLLALQSQPLPEGATAALLSQIARTVGYAHGRGICHLGLCPTNIIVTQNGEARITDFGFLPPRLPAQPAGDPSLRARMPYLTPEQLASESTSAATDVFQLGAIGHEMFMLEPAFAGRTSQDIGRAITSGASASLVLPRPLASVIGQCLARSPFERFPDARALADALDAATRELSLPGGLPDVAEAVRAATERQANVSSVEMSGALNFPLPAPPRADSMITAAGAGQTDNEPATTLRDPSQRPGAARGASLGAPTSSQSAAASAGKPGSPPVPPSLRDRKPGAPRVSPTVQAPASLGARMPLAKAAMEGAAEELDEDMPTTIRARNKGFIQPTPMGLATVDAPLSLRPHSGPTPGTENDADGDDDGVLSSSARPPGAPRSPSKRAPREVDGMVERPTVVPGGVSPTAKPPPHSDRGPRLATPPPLPFADLTADSGDLSSDAIEISAAELELLPPGASDPNRPLPEAQSPPTPPTSDAEAPAATTKARPPLVGRKRPGGPPATISDASDDGKPAIRASNTWDAIAPISQNGGGGGKVRGESHSGVRPIPSLVQTPERKSPDSASPDGRGKRSGAAVALFAALLLAAVGVGGYFAYDRFLRGDGEPSGDERVALNGSDAGAADASAASTRPAKNIDAGGGQPIDAGAPDAGDDPDIDAAPTVPIDDGSDQNPPIQTPRDDGRLVIRSRPSRSKAYLDGSSIGSTTVRMTATKDRHRLAIIKPGYKLFTAEIDGSGEVKVNLEDADSPDGPAGIKVRCSRKNRYYVFVNGQHTGQLCPTERIGVDLGEHTVEIYDPVTETRKQFPVTVEDTRHSVRVRVD